MSILCPTAFNALRFLKLFQRLRRAIRAGDILAKLLLELHLRRLCSHFCELTLNYQVAHSRCFALAIFSITYRSSIELAFQARPGPSSQSAAVFLALRPSTRVLAAARSAGHRAFFRNLCNRRERPVSNNTDPKREHDYEIVLKPPEVASFSPENKHTRRWRMAQ